MNLEANLVYIMSSRPDRALKPCDQLERENLLFLENDHRFFFTLREVFLNVK